MKILFKTNSLAKWLVLIYTYSIAWIAHIIWISLQVSTGLTGVMSWCIWKKLYTKTKTTTRREGGRKQLILWNQTFLMEGKDDDHLGLHCMTTYPPLIGSRDTHPFPIKFNYVKKDENRYYLYMIDYKEKRNWIYHIY